MRTYLLITTLIYAIGWLSACAVWHTLGPGSRRVMILWLGLILWGFWILLKEKT